MESKEEEIILKRGDVEVVLTEKRIADLALEFMEMMAADANFHEDFSMSVKTLDMLIKTKQAFFPATMKNFNVNVQAFDSKLEQWRKTREEMLIAEKEGVKVFEIK